MSTAYGRRSGDGASGATSGAAYGAMSGVASDPPSGAASGVTSDPARGPRLDELPALLRATLAERAGDLDDDGDPWRGVERARARDRRRSRTTALVVGAVLAALVAGAVAAAVRARPGPAVPVAGPAPTGTYLRWPTRGELAGTDYLAAARRQIVALGAQPQRVLFAGDVAGSRVVMVVEAGCAAASCPQHRISVWSSQAGAPAGALRPAGAAQVESQDAAVGWMRPDPRGVSPWLVVTAGAAPVTGPSAAVSTLDSGIDASYAVEVSRGPDYRGTPAVRRSWRAEPVLAGVAEGALGHLAGPTARLRYDQQTRPARSDIVAGPDLAPQRLYAGAFQVVDFDADAALRVEPSVTAALYRRVVTVAGAGAGDGDAADRPPGVAADRPPGAAVARAVETLGRAHWVPADQLTVLAAWYGPVDSEVRALTLVCAVPDGATVLSVVEVRPGGSTTLAVPGRLIRRAQAQAPVLWRTPDDPTLVRVAAPGATSISYFGRTSKDQRLLPGGGGSVRATGPSFITSDGYEQIAIEDGGRLLTQLRVPRRDRLGDADVPPDS